MNQIPEEIQQALFARSQGILTQDIIKKRILIVGTGSVGSYLAEILTRSGVGAFTLIDPEQVELANLCRTTYKVEDIGQFKVDALANHLLEINPLLQLTVKPQSITDFSAIELTQLFQESDLILATTDELKAQRVINHFAYHCNKPALFVGIYEGAKGGEVILSIPEQTPCYLCATSIRHQAEENFGKVTRNVDYGTGRLMGEVALAADIHHVSSVAVKLTLSLLLPEDSEANLKNFAKSAIEKGFTFLTLSMDADYWFYPQLFGNTPGQYAYQSVWLTSQRQETCPVCGKPEHRNHPSRSLLDTPKASDLRKEFNQVSA
ncbi:HesA/MoeB/ThiF family protein [Planktothrix mougeotii]|uniref:ThiF family adenylyltransferase n=1 Tax=Planktothrix mougeotii LEGE 06226 TaxID=1828728 RepID=A0ABR9UG34_9CYAN|nr:ThiF family adenylyltransferase [Planktothrix mougeotii]MBE9145431.1 ThiF family adenylyltransferase [Planktothrix mougeotii LEGE 06226]